MRGRPSIGVGWALAGVLVALAVAGCGSSSGTKGVPASGVAVVGGRTISKARVAVLITQAKASYKLQSKTFPKVGTKAYRTVREQAVGYLVQEAMYEQEAVRLGVTVTPKQVAAAIEQIKQTNFGGSEQQLQAQMKAQGLTEAELEQEERLAVTESQLEKKLTAGLAVSDAAVKAYYDAHASSYVTPASRTVRHILVAKKALADTIYAQLRGGADFAALAKKYSTDKSSAAQGGKLTISKGQTVAPFDKTAFSLKTGQLSPPVHTQFGWHVIQALTAVKQQTKKPLSAVSSSIRQQLLQLKQTTKMNAWIAQTARTYCSGKISYGAGYVPTTAAYDPCAKTRTSSSTATTTP